ncbi:MAG: hypothetical protein ACREIC_04230, partial [Limisphaerales bacterium]
YSLAFQHQQHVFQSLFYPLVGQAGASQKALALSYNLAARQATLLAYIDDFRWLALVTAFCLAAVLLLKKATPHRPGLVAE